ncbi:cation:proton antiporter domain-containing protein [Denitromonas halophila]|uniref:Cation/H+ exchanger transmembrane domain-containing protein n=1 Tax=Denitromonas halophila TaxID=1629404 RepID=A0A557R1J8_9RHOO|nr:cation:proton antiporter [Denitromonas halophila]TVO59032.1 hypothetical protein FHP91_05110 [Denitromonas halophila]
MSTHEPFAELALLRLIAAAVGAVAVRLRQSVLIAHIVVGIAVGPAGFSLASTHFRDAIAARLTGIRDFLRLFFFIDLGAKLDVSSLGGELWPALVLSLFVLIGNPLIVMAIMGAMGYRKRTGFMAGLTVAQISGFSIIFVAMGITLGHIGNDALGLTTLVGIVTIALSTYMILYSQPLFEWIGPWLSVFERRRPHRELAVERQRRPDSPPQWIVTTLPTWESNRGLFHALQSLAVPGVITGVVGDEVHRQALHAAGASRIINPCLDSADHTAQIMVDALNPSEDSP